MQHEISLSFLEGAMISLKFDKAQYNAFIDGN